MKEIVSELQSLITIYSSRLSGIPEVQFSAKPLPHKWSKKEIIGHMCDSAQNNIRRFITGQYEQGKIIYQQDFWVQASGYQSMPSANVIRLWELLNRQVISILTSMPPASYNKEVDTGHETVSLRSLEWLAADYVRHMKHHLNQIFPGSFNVVYP